MTLNFNFIQTTGIKICEHVRKAVVDSGITEEDTMFGLYPKMCEMLIKSKSENTNKSYYHAFLRWEKYIKRNGHQSLPAEPVHVALYLTHLLEQGCSYHVVNSAIYSIKWAHNINGLSDPTQSMFVTSLQEAARRTAYTKTVKKEPVTVQMLIDLCHKFNGNNDLIVIRDLTMILLSFAGFLRFDEISSLMFKDVKVEENYLIVKIEKSKTDQYRQGNEILISKGETIACPYRMYLDYIRIANFKDNSSDQYLFRPCFRSKGVSKLIYKNKKISYTSARENILSRLKLVSHGINLGLHSLRSGGATAAASSAISEMCLKRHGRWKSDSSKDGYIVDTLDKRLQISKVLGL